MNKVIDKYLKNTCTEQERRAVEAFLHFYQNKKENEWPINLTDEVKEAIWMKISYKTIPSTGNTLRLTYLAAAMLVLCIISAGWFAYTLNAPIVKEAGPGEQLYFTLPDQSTVLLSAGSTLTYPKTFGKLREVRFTGEAFFTIQSDHKRPFIVKAGQVTATVLGTSFTVNTFKRNETDVRVVSGKVEVAAGRNKPLVLIPGQMAKVNKKSGETVSCEVKSGDGMQWTKGILFFDGISMREAADSMERWYEVEISFEDEGLERRLIKSEYKNQPLQNVIESLCFVQGMKYRRDGKKIIFTKK